MTITNAQTVTTLALSIAADIEEQGHYQGVDGAKGCCVYVNPTIGTEFGSLDVPNWEGWNLLSEALGKRLGLGDGPISGSIYRWNDTTPTAEVLDTLRSL